MGKRSSSPWTGRHWRQRVWPRAHADRFEDLELDAGTGSPWLGSHDWTDPYTNVRKGAEILSSNMDYFANQGLEGDEQVQAALAAYNHGPGNVWANIEAGLSPDVGTAGGDYAADVWRE